ncbi:MAG: hypothetical protein EXR62_14455 [Chloroflexi bacterium]|nr:hypothetical protein [Chloroflexota bacterium]
MNITWQEGRWLPTFIKGGAMGLVDGRPVYAAGCTFPWRETEQAWYWDASRNDWFPVEPSIPFGRCYTQGINLGDGLLVLGGRKSLPEGRVSLKDAWWLRRNGETFTWTQLPDMHYPRAIASIGISGQKILAFGGGEWEKSQGGAFVTRHLTNYEILDLEHLSTGWRDMGPLPFPSLVGSAFASIDKATYVFGGYECWSEDKQRKINYYSTAWRYDFAQDRWTQMADFPCVASGWAAVPYDNQIILMAGGLKLDLMGVKSHYLTHPLVEKGSGRQRMIGAYSDLVFVYDVATNTYRRLENRLPIGNNDIRCTISGNTIYVAGGETTDLALSNCSNAFLIGTISP